MAEKKFDSGNPVLPSEGRKASSLVSNEVGQGFTVPFTTSWKQFIATDVCVALSGTATSVTALVERSTVDPDLIVNGVAQGPVISPADSSGITGNLSTGVPPNIYTEPGAGWWRVNVTAIAGGNCTASITGQLGGHAWPNG